MESAAACGKATAGPTGHAMAKPWPSTWACVFSKLLFYSCPLMKKLLLLFVKIEQKEYSC